MKLENETSELDKMVVVQVLQSKGFGDLLKIRDHLKHQKHIKYRDITLDKENMEVLITGSNRKDIERAIEWHSKGMRNAGHGGYRINFKVTEIKITLEEIVRKKLENEFEEKVNEMNSERKELEVKWSKNKKGMSRTIDKFSGKIRKQDVKIDELWKKNNKIKKYLNGVENELGTYHIPAYKIVWRRFKEFVGNKEITRNVRKI